jgi:hypothetical protein
MQSDAYSKCGKNSEKGALVFGCGICDGLKASQSRVEKGARAGQAFFGRATVLESGSKKFDPHGCLKCFHQIAVEFDGLTITVAPHS